MHSRRYLWLMAALAALAGCGSGSSGFDELTEDAAIERALASGSCVEQPSLAICPADVPAAAPGRVHTGLDTAVPVSCAVALAGDECRFTLPVAAEGFSPGATYRVAVRNLDPAGKWTIGEASGPQAPGMETPVAAEAPGTDGGDGGRIQLAVLVYVEPRAQVPVEVDNLADSGADYAFVTPPLTLAPAVGTP